MHDHDVYELARAAGLSREWRNAWGEPQEVSPEALRRILAALDLPCSTAGECQDSRARLEAQLSGTVLPPLLTAVVGQPLRIPGGAWLAGRPWQLTLEDGETRSGREGEVAGGHLLLPAVNRMGYHSLAIGDISTTVAVAPERCFTVADALRQHGGGKGDPARLWGLGVQLYSLRRPGDGGLGDFGALADLGERAAAQGAAALAISPVHAMFSADLGRFSPYGPSSRLFLNALHIDPEAVLGRNALISAVEQLDAGQRQSLAAAEEASLVDWPVAGGLRLALLRRLFERYQQEGAHGELEAFRAENGQALRDHARFEALHTWHLAQGKSGYWRDWEAGLRNPQGEAVERFAAAHAEEVRFHEFLQWQAARGLEGAQQRLRAAGMPLGLIADLAVGADNGGSQAWSRQTEILRGLSVGAPPDVMNPHGQSWGLGAFSPHAMQAQGFGAYLEMVRAAFRYAGGIRIDHILGLHRLWLVPDGASAVDGAYLHYPMEDLLRLIALESWRHEAVVIGEDLGTVPEGFDRTLADRGIMGIRVLLFQRDGERFLSPGEWPAEAIATTTTHDLPTIAGWWAGRDIAWRSQLGLLEKGRSEADAQAERERERQALATALQAADVPPAAAGQPPLEAVAAFIGATPAPLAMIPVEDALGLVEQPNLPGTTNEHPNWRRRLPEPVDRLLDAPTVRARLSILNQSRSTKRKS